MRTGGSKISASQRRRLNRLGFVWNVFAEDWEANFKSLQKFVRENGHSMVPKRAGCSFSKWVGLQRKERNKGKLDAERIRRLDALGFVWDVYAHRWEAGFAELVAYQKKYGDCKVSKKINPRLCIWVTTQRNSLKKGTLPEDYKVRLDKIGFNWAPHTTQWAQHFSDLKDYVSRFGHCNVPVLWSENPSLGRWVFRQRSLWGRLSDERRVQLESLGVTE